MKRNEENEVSNIINEWMAQGEKVDGTSEPKRFDILSDDVQTQVSQIAIDVSETSERFIDLLAMVEDDFEDEAMKTKLNQALNEFIASINDASASFEELV